MHWREYPALPELQGFRAIETDRARLLVRAGHEGDAEVLSGLRIPGEATWVGGGRAAHPLVILACGEPVLLRFYRRGGFIRRFNRDRYFAGHRSFDELVATERASTGGANVPVVVAAAEVRQAVGYTATLATRWIPEASPVLDRLASEAPRRTHLLRSIGAEIGKLHRAGIAHPDLNLNNFLVAASTGDITVLDFDRARLYRGEAPTGARRRNLLRLGRSARKLGVPLSEADWMVMREGYGTGWPLTDALG